jgi:hypothetical protein
VDGLGFLKISGGKLREGNGDCVSVFGGLPGVFVYAPDSWHNADVSQSSALRGGQSLLGIRGIDFVSLHFELLSL